MRIHLLKLSAVLRVIKRDVRPSSKDVPTRETEKKSTTSGTIGPEVWIMSGLLLSLVQQIAVVSRQQRLEDRQDINNQKENNDEL